jgi:hypothetical protein
MPTQEQKELRKGAIIFGPLFPTAPALHDPHVV